MGVPLHYGFSDGAAVFVFLSGYVSGLVYSKVYDKMGLRGLILKAGRRACQLYSAHLLVLLSLFDLSAIIPTSRMPEQMLLFLARLSHGRFTTVRQILGLQYFPFLCDILPLYVLFILSIPFFLPLIKRNWKAGLGLAFALYVSAQFLPALNIEARYASWSLNPFCWLFLFVTAMTLSIKTREGTLKIPVRSALVAGALGVMIYAFFDLKPVNGLLLKSGISRAYVMPLFPSPFPLAQKNLQQPVALLHFFCFAYVVFFLKPYFHRLYESPLARPFKACGQNSLPVYTAGIVLNYVAACLIAPQQWNHTSFYLFSLTGWGVIIALGMFLSRLHTVRPGLQTG